MGLEARMPPLLPDSDFPNNDAHDADHNLEQSPPPSPLPPLTNTPTSHPSSCLTLSAPLLTHLSSLLPPTALTLSIGSGTGALEAHLLALSHNIIGLEVSPSPNKYLPQAYHCVVTGSRFLDPMAAEAEVWMFVYPRRVGLVEEYIKEYGQSVRKIVWAGPRGDWEDYKGVFEGWGVQVWNAEDVGGTAWEMMAVAKRKGATLVDGTGDSTWDKR